jgi:hypothetical protein
VTGDIEFILYTINTWTVDVDVENATTTPSSVPSPVDDKYDELQFTLNAASGYRLPDADDIIVTMGGNQLTLDSDYTYTLSADKTTAEFTLTVAGGITGNVVIAGTSIPTWVITPHLRNGVTFSPATATTVDEGEDFVFTLVMADTYLLKDVKTISKKGVETLLSPSYDIGTGIYTCTITNVTEDLEIIVTVDKTWAVSADVSNASTSLSSNPLTLYDGDPLEFTLTANSGYRLPDTITVMMGTDALSLGASGYTYTLSADKLSAVFELTSSGGIMEDVTITGTSVKTWDITVPSDASKYETNKSGTNTIDDGTNFTFTLKAAAGYRINPAGVSISGTGSISYSTPVDGVYTYTITGIGSDVTVVIDLSNGLVKTWDITVPSDASKYETNKSGTNTIDDGADFVFTLSAVHGYRINPAGVSITGSGSLDYAGPDANGVYTYTITNITSDVTVVIDMNNGLIKTWDVTLSNGNGYVLDPEGDIYAIDEGDSFTFMVEVLAGYIIPDVFVIITPGTGSGTLSVTQIDDNAYEFTITNITGDITVLVNLIKLYTVNVTYNAGAEFEYTWDNWETVYTPELDQEGGVYSFEVPEGSVLRMRAVSYDAYDVAWEDDASPTRHIGPNFTGPTTRGGSDIEELNISLTFTLTIKSGAALWFILAAIMIAALIILLGWVREKEEEEEKG